jgi:hypothetical protein
VVRILIHEGDCTCRRFHFHDLRNQCRLDQFPTTVLKVDFFFFGEQFDNFSQPLGLFRHGERAISGIQNAYIPNITIYLLGT